MTVQEKAFTAASIQVKIDADKKEAKEMKKKSRRR
jgi:hypothetical protein